MSAPDPSAPRVALFATCLVDAMRPRVGFAAVSLLEAAGCVVEIPRGQTCCGQPALNSGDHDGAAAVARHTIALLEGYDAVVVPSGSCAGTICAHYSDLFPAGSDWRRRALALAAKTFELFTYLADVRRWRPERVALAATATYHDSCSGLRELGVKAQPRQAARGSGRARARRDGRRGDLLRLRRHVLRQVPRDLERHRLGKDRRHRRHRRGPAAGRRSRLPDEHGRPAAPRRPDGTRLPCGRSARRHGRRARRSEKSR